MKFEVSYNNIACHSSLCVFQGSKCKHVLTLFASQRQLHQFFSELNISCSCFFSSESHIYKYCLNG